MLTEDITLTHFLVSVGLIIGGFLIGVILEKVILSRLRRFAKRTSWEGDEIIINSIKGVAILWFPRRFRRVPLLKQSDDVVVHP